jgi:YD repeat-containing protein
LLCLETRELLEGGGWGRIPFNPVYNPNAPNNHADIFSYDGMGNVTNDVSHTYSYDAEGRATSIDNNGIVVYYDAFGRAVTVKTNGTYRFSTTRMGAGSR